MGNIQNPITKTRNSNFVSAHTGTQEIHNKIKKNNPIRSMTDVIGNKVYPRIKTKFNLPLGW